MHDNFKFDFDEETRTTTCTITDKQGNTFIGKATCHLDDIDMLNPYTGQEIAAYRAELEALRFYRDNEFTVSYKTLNHLYNNIQQSKYYNPHDYATKMLKRQVNIAYDNLEAIKDLIDIRKKQLLFYIDQKDKFYNQIRTLRKVKQLEEEHKNF